MTYVFIVDSKFPLTTGIIKQYQYKCLTRSVYCRLTENAFVIMASVFENFYPKISVSPDKATKTRCLGLGALTFIHVQNFNCFCCYFQFVLKYICLVSLLLHVKLQNIFNMSRWDLR